MASRKRPKRKKKKLSVTQKPKEKATRTSLKSGEELRCSVFVGVMEFLFYMSCYSCYMNKERTGL
jgi:hypothetical protein